MALGQYEGVSDTLLLWNFLVRRTEVCVRTCMGEEGESGNSNCNINL